jgi:peptidyl-prolyl cis-trans isomerase D
MLNTIRKQAGSWIVKALLLLLVASFAVWGIGDVFYGGGQNPAVATVGESEISSLELSEAFNQRLNNLQRRLGNTIDREQAIQLGLMQSALQDLIAGRLIDLRARDMGLRVSEEMLREEIAANPMFQTAGQFDSSRFEQLLLANGMTEDGYLAVLRQDLARQMLTGSLTGPVTAPEPLVDALYRYRNEQRRGRFLLVDPASIADVPEPTDEQLAAFLEDHPDRFTAPEYRKVTFVTLEPEDLLDEVATSDEQVEAAYQERLAQYRTPERRTVEQLLAPDQATIEQAAERVAAGASFEAVAEEIEEVTTDRFESITKGDLPADLEEAVLALGEGEVSRPVESAFGWHLFRVSEIQPETTKPLAEVRDDLARELALAEASERLPSLANQLDDELAAGVELAEAARTVGLEAKTLAAIDARGLNPEGTRPDSLPSWPEFLRVVFEAPAGETSLLEETADGGYFVVEVAEITPQRVKSLDEARDQVADAWRAERRQELARERAEALLARAKESSSLDQLAGEQGVSMQPIGPVKRTGEGAGQGMDRALVRALFATEPGKVADEAVPAGDGFALVVADEVIAADPLADPDAVERLRTELEADMQGDLLAQLEATLKEDYPVEIHAAAINRVIGQDGF